MSSQEFPLVSVNIVVLNGEKYIRHCLNSIRDQTHPLGKIELNIIDNGSTDNTEKIIKEELRDRKFFLFKSKKNLSMWGGQEKALEFSNGKYILALSVDVLLDPRFIEESVRIFQKNHQVGAIQAKIYRYKLGEQDEKNKIQKTNIIDTCGFEIFRSRRIANIDHGKEDRGQYDRPDNGLVDIFAVEGAAPIFRRKTLDDCRICGEIVDHDMFWYGDDIDLGWRMNLFGWRQIYTPKVIAHHDRKTTHTLSKNKKEFIEIRKKIPALKRRLDYRNTRLMFIKNDYLSNFLKDLTYFLKREVLLWGYFLIFEPFLLLEIPNTIKMLPRMIKKRRKIMKRVKVSPDKIHEWFK